MKDKRILAFIFLCTLSFYCQADNQLSVFEDLLYWHASQQTTSDWAYQFIPTPSNNPSFPITQGTYFTEPNVHFDWSTGLRIGVQYKPLNFFDAKLYWTNYSTTTKESANAPSGQALLPEFFNGFSTANLYNHAQLNWVIKMNMVDFEIGHQFKPAASFTLRPFIGIKGGTINQSIHSSWQLNIFDIQIYSATENLNNNFFGIGPTVGFNGLWNLYKGFSIRGDFEGGLLWGRWNIKDSLNRPGLLLLPAKTIISTTKDTLGTFMSSYFLGFEWVFKTKLPVTFNVGYEMQYWSNQLRLPMFQALPIHGDLTLQGGTCGIFINLY
jgi:hypothetical protein